MILLLYLLCLYTRFACYAAMCRSRTIKKPLKNLKCAILLFAHRCAVRFRVAVFALARAAFARFAKKFVKMLKCAILPFAHRVKAAFRVAVRPGAQGNISLVILLPNFSNFRLTNCSESSTIETSKTERSHTTEYARGATKGQTRATWQKARSTQRDPNRSLWTVPQRTETGSGLFFKMVGGLTQAAIVA